MPDPVLDPDEESVAPLVESLHEAAPPDPGDAAPTLGQALRSRAYQAALAANLTNGFVTFGLRSSLVPLFVIEGLQSDATLSGIGFLVAAATQAILLLPAGRLADQRGRRPALHPGHVPDAAGHGGAGPDQRAGPVPGRPWAISGLAAAFMGSAPAAVAGDVVGPGGRGIVIAVFQMTSDLGAIMGPLIAGLLADRFGYGPAFEVGVVVAAFALVMAAIMPETLRRGGRTETSET